MAVVSVPPPITGQATAARVLLDEFDRAGVSHRVFDTASPVTGNGTAQTVRTIIRTLGLTARLLIAPGGRDTLAYFQLGQGPSSILRDTPLLAVAALRRWRTIGHLHGGGWRDGLDRLPPPARRIYLALLRRAEAIVVLTPRLRALFDDLGMDDKLRVVGNGVERHIAEAAAAHPARWSPTPTVLFLANLMPEKGIDTLLDAAGLAETREPSLRFVVAGGSDVPVDTSTWPSNATYAGVVSGVEKEQLLSEAHVLALPTTYWVEGEPISILEAFHFGLPVVTCDRGGIADIVGQDNGAIIPANDPEALLAAIVTNTCDRVRWESVADTNRRQAKNEHSPEAHLTAMFDLFGLARS